MYVIIQFVLMFTYCVLLDMRGCSYDLIMLPLLFRGCGLVSLSLLPLVRCRHIIGNHVGSSCGQDVIDLNWAFPSIWHGLQVLKKQTRT